MEYQGNSVTGLIHCEGLGIRCKKTEVGGTYIMKDFECQTEAFVFDRRGDRGATGVYCHPNGGNMVDLVF